MSAAPDELNPWSFPPELLEQYQRFVSDPRFAIENLYVVKNQQTRKLVPFRYNEAQVLLEKDIQWFRERNRGVRLWVCKARRAGLSTGCEANIYHDTTFHANTDSLIVANQTKPAENILEMCRKFWEHTPDPTGDMHLFKPELPPEFRNRPPKDRLVFPDRASRIFIATARSLEQYLSYGFQNMHCTEVARYQQGDELMLALYPTLVEDEHSMFFGESTPLGQGNFFHEQCMLAHETGGRFSKEAGEFGGFRLGFYPWHIMIKSFSKSFKDDLERRVFKSTLTEVEVTLQRRFPHITLEQLKWRRAKIAGPPFNKDADLFDQEYPTDLETAFLATGHSVFGRSDLKTLVENKRHPVFEGDIYWGTSTAENLHVSDYDLVRKPALLTEGKSTARYKYAHERFEFNSNDGNRKALRLYRVPEKGERIVIAGDVGGGLGDPKKGEGDYSTLIGIIQNDFAPNEVFAVWKGLIQPVNFARVAATFAWWCRTKVGDLSPPLLALEWGGQGVPANTYLENRHLYEPCFYYFAPGIKGTPKTHHIGWESNFKTKPMAVGMLRDMVARHDIDIPDGDVIMEMGGYRSYAGQMGEEYGGNGMHDDLVSALYIGAALIRLNKLPGAPGEISSYADEDIDREFLGDGEPFGLDEDQWDDEDDDERYEIAL